MKKFAKWFVAMAVFAGIGMTVMGSGVASAAGPDNGLQSEFGPRPWLRESIVLAAAETIGVSPVVVRDSLLNGVSLNELAQQHGDGPVEFTNGLVEHNRTILDNWADDGYITHDQALHGDWYLSTHLFLVVTFSF